MHDRTRFLAELDPDRRATRFRQDQQAQFDNLTDLPLTAWSYSADAVAQAPEAQAATRRRLCAPAVVVKLTLRYALRAVDARPTARDLWWTFVRRDGRMRIAGDTDLANDGGVSWQGPWDFGPLQVVAGRSSLVLGHPDQAGLLASIAKVVDAAVPAVSAVWGTGWTQQVAVLVPSSPDELDAELGATTPQTVQIAALAVSDGQDAVTGTVLGQRLVVEPAVYSRLSTIGRQIVVRHEVTHVADAKATTGATPRWLAEGFADYVGNLHSGQPVGVAASELRADVRRGRASTHLPTENDFDAGTSAAQAYEGSWLACRLIAARAGPAGLMRFYRLVAASPDDPDTAVAGALRAVLGLTPRAFVTAWRAYVAAQLR